MQQLIGSGPHLREGSPAQNAERIQVPVLMVAGGLGHDSTIDQTRVMHGALSTAGKKVELIEYPGVAQDLDDSDVRAEMLRSEEHTSELQSLMSIWYAALCLIKKKTQSN